MEMIAVKILLKNLLNRVETQEDGSKQLTGRLTDDELAALHAALDAVDGLPTATRDAPTQPATRMCNLQPISPGLGSELQDTTAHRDPLPEERTDDQLDLDFRAIASGTPSNDMRVCLDFGTAMSKATAIEDGQSEEIHVLPLGIPGDQEEISTFMLISSVYIDDDGMLWFGKAAVDRSMIAGRDGSRGRLDNIKRRLSEEGWDERVGARFNTTGVPVTHGDMVLAYLMFMTWTVNCCLEEKRFPRHLLRRFAMPCLPGEKGREIVHRLKTLVGEAQILADTFSGFFKNGVPIHKFCFSCKCTS